MSECLNGLCLDGQCLDNLCVDSFSSEEMGWLLWYVDDALSRERCIVNVFSETLYILMPRVVQTTNE